MWIFRNGGSPFAAVSGKAAGRDDAVTVAAGVAEYAVIVPDLREGEDRRVRNAEIAEHHPCGGEQRGSFRGGDVDGVQAQFRGAEFRPGLGADMSEKPGDSALYLVRLDDAVVILIDEVEKLAVGAEKVDVDAGESPVGLIEFQYMWQVVDIAQCQLTGSADSSEHHI